MGNYLQGKSIVVTGAGSGIGRAVAIACAAEGASVVVADYGVGIAGEDPTSEVADAVVKEITDAGGTAIAVADTVTSMDGGARMVQTAVDKFGRIDGAVCVAGILRERMLFNMSEDEWDGVIDTHLKGTFTVFRAAAAVMRKQEGGGSLVAFTSGVGRRLHLVEPLDETHLLLADLGVDAGLDLLGRPAAVLLHLPDLDRLVPHRDLPAVGGVHLAGDVPGLVTQEVDDKRRHVLRLAHVELGGHVHRHAGAGNRRYDIGGDAVTVHAGRDAAHQ